MEGEDEELKALFDKHMDVEGEIVRPQRQRPGLQKNQFISTYGMRTNSLNRRASVRNLTHAHEEKRVNLYAQMDASDSSNRGGRRDSRYRRISGLSALDEGDSLHTTSTHSRIGRSARKSFDTLKSKMSVRNLFAGMDDSSKYDQEGNFRDESVGRHGSSGGMGGSSGRRGLLQSRMSVKNLFTGGLDSSGSHHSRAKATIDEDHNISCTVDGRDVFENYKNKPANSIFRWNLLWLVLCLFAPYPLWLSFVNCRVAYEITIVINIIMALNFIYTTILCWKYMWRMVRAFNTPFWQELDDDVRDRVQHICVMPTYKEPVELLLETISSVANQTVADSIIMVVGMEEKTPDQANKKAQINEQFGDSFKALVYAVHPSGVNGEIPGACSNRNYAARTAVKNMIRAGLLPVDPETKEVDLDFTTVTVCDADTTFFYRYFENLTWLFLKEDPLTRYKICWQSPLFYNISLDERWFFTRVMGILRSYFMIGFLIGCDINTMSIYSQSLRLLIDSRYFHPGYQMDDIIYTLSAMKATGMRIRIKSIDIPTLSGPTSGDTVWTEFEEWVVQATRWTIGAAEVFHYFFVKLLRGNYWLPGFAYFWWFVYYYGFVLCVAGLVNISNMIIQLIGLSYENIAIEQCQPFGLGDDFAYQWIFPGFLIFTYVVVFGTAFFMDRLVSQILALDETIHPIRNFCHFLSSQLVLWVYCFVEYKSIFTIAIYGKEVCGHKASEKHALVGSTKVADESLPPKSGSMEEGMTFGGGSLRTSTNKSTGSLRNSLRNSGRGVNVRTAPLTTKPMGLSSSRADNTGSDRAKRGNLLPISDEESSRSAESWNDEVSAADSSSRGKASFASGSESSSNRDRSASLASFMHDSSSTGSDMDNSGKKSVTWSNEPSKSSNEASNKASPSSSRYPPQAQEQARIPTKAPSPQKAQDQAPSLMYWNSLSPGRNPFKIIMNSLGDECQQGKTPSTDYNVYLLEQSGSFA